MHDMIATGRSGWDADKRGRPGPQEFSRSRLSEVSTSLWILCNHTYIITTYIHTCMHTYIHTYTHTCIHTYVQAKGVMQACDASASVHDSLMIRSYTPAAGAHDGTTICPAHFDGVTRRRQGNPSNTQESKQQRVALRTLMV